MIARIRAWGWRLAAALGFGRTDEELAEEIQTHLALDAAARRRAGLSEDEARRQAALAFGGVDSVTEQYRDRRSVPFVESTLQDLRYAVRTFRRTPGFAVAALVVLALGIGANTAIFTVVNAVLLRPLPYAEPDRLTMVWHVPPAASFPGVKQFAVSPANFFDWQRQQRSFERMVIARFHAYALTGHGQAEQLRAGRVSPGFFQTLGVRPLHGRWLLAEEDEPGRDQVCVLGYRLWKGRFGGDPSIVGRTILLDGSPRTVVGIAGPDLAFPDWAQLWTPLAWTDKERAVRSNHNCMVLARLAPGVDLRQAQAEMDAISLNLARQYPEDDKGWGALVVPFHEDLVGDLRPALLVLLGAVGFVLLIACANVANLVLVRTLGRRRELAVRLALGAGAGRIVRQVLTETTLLAGAGAILGLALAFPAVRLITAYLGDRLPRGISVEPDARVLVFTALAALATGLAAGLAPALRLARANVVDGIKQGGGRADSESAGTRLRATLLVIEVALSLVLLVGAGLMVRSLSQLSRVDAGLDPANVLTASVELPEPRYPERDQQWRFFEQVLERARALPGVESVGAVTNLPMGDGGNQWPVQIAGRPQLSMAEQPQVQGNVVTPAYLRALRIGVVRGRGLDAGDRPGRQPVVLVSESTARWLWPGEDPIGQRFTIGFFPDEAWQVVGIVKDVKERGLAEEGTRSIYLPMAQMPVPQATLVLRTSTEEPGAAAQSLVAAVHEVDPDLPVVDVLPMEFIVARSMADRRVTMFLLAAFAGLALLLAAVGIYSVLAYAVRRRVREIGIRIALGADGGGVVRMVVTDALRPTLLGLALGLVGAVAIRGVMASLVYGVAAGDPLTFAAVSALLLGVALAATALPAYGASRVDPVVALRDE
jgi:putative ABC transport system permease protein